MVIRALCSQPTFLQKREIYSSKYFNEHSFLFYFSSKNIKKIKKFI